MIYANYIRSKPCLICGKKSQLSHQRVLGGGGTSKRPPDTHALPLCDEHHKEEHLGSIWFWQKYYPEYDAPGMRKEMVQLLILKKILKLVTEYIQKPRSGERI